MFIDLSLTVERSDYENLRSGRKIAILFSPLLVDRQFVLAPKSDLIEEEVVSHVIIKVVARESLKLENLNDAIARLLDIPLDVLKQRLDEDPRLCIICFRAYYTDQKLKVACRDSIGFAPLSHPYIIEEFQPLLSDYSFARRREQFLNHEIADSKLIEDIYFELNAQHFDNIEFKLSQETLSSEIQILLGWKDIPLSSAKLPEWTQAIAKVGNSSDGNDFEKLVRKGLIELGFSASGNLRDFLDPDKCGGAGGLDFYCDAPFAVVGECKATKSEKVPDGTAAQLVKLGYKHLQKKYNSCVKIIMTEDAELTASGNEMNVIRPETLQRLVELKSRHSGSINLLALKPCLEQEPHGEAADKKLNDFIDQIWVDLRVRSHLVQLIKKASTGIVGIEYLRGAYDASNPPKAIFNSQEFHETLIELSSPLAGYLGREKDSNGKGDRFYFLRDLLIEKEI
jgi:hypothetical protein